MNPPPAAEETSKAPRNKLPKRARLLKASEFKTILRRPLTASDPLFRICARETKGHSRLGITVSRKCAARAIDRNRIKRHVREAFRHIRSELDVEKGVEVIVIARPEARLAFAAELRQALALLFRRIKQRISHQSETD